MDVGGIQRIVQVWIHGDQTDAIFNVENGNYTLDYKMQMEMTSARAVEVSHTRTAQKDH